MVNVLGTAEWIIATSNRDDVMEWRAIFLNALDMISVPHDLVRLNARAELLIVDFGHASHIERLAKVNDEPSVQARVERMVDSYGAILPIQLVQLLDARGKRIGNHPPKRRFPLL
jgi:hypothetical protein